MGKPHGLDGEAYVVAISDDPTRFHPGARLLLEGDRELVVASSRRHGDRLLVRFEGVASREDVAGIRGALYVGSGDLRTLDEDEYWPHDIVGCRVLGPSGAVIGELRDVLPGVAHDLFVVATPRGERLVPAVKDIVVSVDARAREIRLDPPPGLVD